MRRSGGSSENRAIRVEVRLYGEAARVVRKERFISELSEGSIVRDAVEDLCGAYPAVAEHLLTENGDVRPAVNLLLNGRPVRSIAGLETRLEDGDRLFVLHAYGGG